MLPWFLLINFLQGSIFQNKSDKGAPDVIFAKTTLCKQMAMYHSEVVFGCFFEKYTNLSIKESLRNINSPCE